MEGFPGNTAHEIAIHSEHMREVLTFAMKDLLP